MSNVNNIGPLIVRRVPLKDILDLRQRVIIDGTGRRSPEFPGDHDPMTHHFAVYQGDRVVGCGTFLPSEWEDEPAWQLRGMATEPAHQGRGIGRELLQFAEDTFRTTSDRRRLWCNARIAAAPFYEMQGWRIVSEEFVLEGVGAHVRMTKEL